MKSFLTAAFSALAIVAGSAALTDPIYENFGEVTTPPQIDALAFANYGDFSVQTTLPFDFQNTENFTNRGTMSADPGFNFATASSRQPPYSMASNFVNEVGALITAGSVQGVGQGAGVPIGVPFSTLASSSTIPSYLLVNADTIINRGILLAGGGGLLQVQGRNVDLSRGGLGIGRLELNSTHSVTDSNFFPDPGIYDNYWSLTNQFDMRMANLIRTTKTATNVTSPRHAVTNSSAFPFPRFVTVAISITNTNMGAVSVMTNAGGADPTTGLATNIYRQAVFVAVSDTNLAITVKWAPSTIATNPFQTAYVEISLANTNVVTGDLESSTLFLKDSLASWTNYVVLTNLSANPVTFIPATFELTRTPPLEFLTATAGNGTFTNNMFFNGADTNFIPIVTNVYAAYSAQIDSLASVPPAVSGLQITDYPGRVDINADNLDLTLTRLRGSALVSIKTPNLLGIRGVQVDSENVIYDLTVPDGTLALQGVAKEKVVRLNGPLVAWSGLWTNFFGIIQTNKVDDGTGTGTLTNVVTNIVTELDSHMLIVDATGLSATKPVTTYDFITHANDVVLSDPLTVVRSFLIDAETFTLNSRLTLSGQVTNWVSTNAPRLKAFTSKGSLDVPNIAYLGADTRAGYDSFANNGSLAADGILIKSTAFGNSGTITSRVDGITIETETGQFQNARTLSARDMHITGTDLRITASTNLAVGKLTLTASHSLADAGDGDSNLIHVGNGFDLPVKPALGDLLGTTIETIAPRFAMVEHTWAGEDRGPSATGFQDNVAIGHLVLGGGQDSLLSFRGAIDTSTPRNQGTMNGMYVDLLELTGPLTNAVAAGDISGVLFVETNLTIYFANSNVPADQLTTLSGGRLQHVDFNGTAEFVQVPVRSGTGTVQMERSVRQSTTLDSDGDGVPNAYDPYPLDYDAPLRLSGSRTSDETTIVLSWAAAPQTTYQVEYTSDLQSPQWQLLSTFTNTGSVVQTGTVQDQLKDNHAQRYYRVRSAQ